MAVRIGGDPDRDIQELFVYVATKDGKEGVMGASVEGFPTPLFSSNAEFAKGGMRQVAEEIAFLTGTGFKLLRFSNREEILEGP